MGHIVPYLSIVESLQAKGHEIVFILRDLSRAALLVKTGVACFQAPLKLWRARNPVKTPLTYAHILHNVAFDDLDSSAGLVEGWRALFATIEPDLIIIEHSPTALLAARGYAFKKMLMGTGFVIPPPVYPFPNLRSWVEADVGALADDEDGTLAIINGLLERYRLERLECIGDLFAVPRVLTTFKELDPYEGREDADYYGTWENRIGEEPVWPEGQGKRAFGYLKPFPTLPSLLSRLATLKIVSLVYVEKENQRFATKFNSPTLRFVKVPQDMGRIAAQCDFAILNGTHNTSVDMLLAGKPSLHVPLFLEQSLTAGKIELMGAGLSAATLAPDEIAAKLELLLTSDRYAEAAKAFSLRYESKSAEEQKQRVVEFIEGLLV